MFEFISNLFNNKIKINNFIKQYPRTSIDYTDSMYILVISSNLKLNHIIQQKYKNKFIFKSNYDDIFHFISNNNNVIIIIDSNLINYTQIVMNIRYIKELYELPIILLVYKNTNINNVDIYINDIIINYDDINYKINEQIKLYSIYKSLIEYKSKINILNNILPTDIITDLQNGKQKISKFHKNISCLFTDIVGYTNMSSVYPTEIIIDILHNLFCEFDNICKKYNAYKVETIVDSYMIIIDSENNQEHGKTLILIAIEMLEVVKNISPKINIRIGLHSGSAYSGVLLVN
jgi:hypothetical protein